MQTKINLSDAQIGVMKIEGLLGRLGRNAAPVINNLTAELLAAENAESYSPQDIFDLWGKNALSQLQDIKLIATKLEKITPGCTMKLRDDFAIPEMLNGKPTGRLIYKASNEAEEN